MCCCIASCHRLGEQLHDLPQMVLACDKYSTGSTCTLQLKRDSDVDDLLCLLCNYVAACLVTRKLSVHVPGSLLGVRQPNSVDFLPRGFENREKHCRPSGKVTRCKLGKQKTLLTFSQMQSQALQHAHMHAPMHNQETNDCCDIRQVAEALR